MRLSFLSLVMCCSLLLASCHKGNRQDKSGDKTVFRYNESAGITSLDPAFAKDQANIWAVTQLYNGLVQMDDSLHIKPCIASRWEISKDGLRYTFHLRNDVFFHDHSLFPGGKGRKVTADDFRYSFYRIIDEKVASPGSWIFNSVMRNTKNGFIGFESLDDSTFRITLATSFPPFLGLLCMPYCSVVPREVVEYYGKDFRIHPIGTGPFAFRVWKEGTRLIYLRNDHYFEQENGKRLPYLDAVSISFVNDRQSAFMDFLKGDLDFMSGVGGSYKDELLTRDGQLREEYLTKFNMYSQPYLNTEYLGFLMDPDLEIMKDSPLRLKKIRQAINYAINRQQMITYLRNGIGTPANSGMIPEGFPAFDSKAVQGYAYDPQKAAKLLIEAGFPGGKGLPEIALNTTSTYQDLCEFIQSQLANVGIPVRIEINQSGVHRELVARSKLSFFRGSWIADYPDEENYLALFYSKNFTPIGPNYTHYSNPAFDRLYELSQKEMDQQKRYNYYHQMDRMILEDAPVVVLYYDKVVRFYGKNIEGLGSNPMNLLTLKRVRKLPPTHNS